MTGTTSAALLRGFARPLLAIDTDRICTPITDPTTVCVACVYGGVWAHRGGRWRRLSGSSERGTASLLLSPGRGATAS